MRVLSWNLNHRAGKRRIPSWIAASIAQSNADIVILTEYVVGLDHDRFLSDLSASGFVSISLSERCERQNRILIASTEPHEVGHMRGPGFHPAVPPNSHHVVLGQSGLHVLGVRVPAFKGETAVLNKRKTLEWLLASAREIGCHPAVIAGDLNTSPETKSKREQEFFSALCDAGWSHACPETGFSWRHPRSGSEWRIDHAFASGKLTVRSSSYSWEFQDHVLAEDLGKVGLPDHAMLLVEINVERG